MVNFSIGEIHIRSGLGRANITRFGGQVTSWVPSEIIGEQLFMAARERHRPHDPIRGGVPIIFPQFGIFGSGPRHGTVRTREWQQRENERNTNNAAASTLFTKCTSSEDGIDATIELTVELTKNQLILHLRILHEGVQPTPFGVALHTYLKVSHIDFLQIDGLQGKTFLDFTGISPGSTRLQNEPSLQINDEIDRIYLDPPPQLRIQDHAGTRIVEQTGFSNTVIWNPGPVKAALLPELSEQDYSRFVCLEAAHIFTQDGDRPVLEPGASWMGSQTLRVVC